MISNKVKVTSHIEVWIDNESRKVTELIFDVKGYGTFMRRGGEWMPLVEDNEGMYDDIRVIAVEKEDARKLELKEKFDAGQSIDIDEVAKYEAERYYGQRN